MSKLWISMKLGESVEVDNGRLLVTYADKNGKTIRLSLEAEESLTIRGPIKIPKPPLEIHRFALVG